MFCSMTLTGTTLAIGGDHTDNSIYIEDTGFGQVLVRCDSPWEDFDNIEQIYVNSGQGNDVVFFNQWAGRTEDMELDVLLGSGDDHFYAG